MAALLAVLAEAYQRILSISANPVDCTPNTLAVFQKVDEKIRKNIVAWLVKEVEDYSRGEVQRELDSLDKFISITPQ